MRLTHIRLAGFKSFVDPTHIPTPGQLVAIVGPNGCGKSNVIDAVRWVLGESKASALRGESMQDVIFNGAGDRKPVGRASVELVFDNSAGRAAGQWSQYAELSIKRVLQRDGESSYHINNLVVRRRDITDLFLGTGLGPRAYAIIEQGMISRIIEAKPEELRVFLEEAAGVSKYKERRKETSARLADARDNLLRVDDIRQELGNQLEKLSAQAQVATEFQRLQAELELTQQLFWFGKKADAERTQAKLAAEIAQQTNTLEAATAQLRQLETDLEHLRTEHFAAQDALHGAQGEFYAANAEVTRVEQELSHLGERRQRLELQIGQLDRQRQELAQQQASVRQEQGNAEAEVLAAAERVLEATAEEEAVAAGLPDVETVLQNAQNRFNDVQRDLAEAERAVQLEEAHIGHADKLLSQLSTRKARLDQERAGLKRPDTTQTEEIRLQLEEEHAELELRQQGIEEMAAALPGLEESSRQAGAAALAAGKALTELEARLQALVSLQAKLNRGAGNDEWLVRHGLQNSRRLWQAVHIEAGWEDALEAVLRERLNAIPVAQLEQVAQWHDAPGHFAAYETEPSLSEERSAGADAAVGLTPLFARLQISEAGLQALLADWLAGVFGTEDLAAALAQRQQLAPGQLLVTRQGHLVTRQGMSLFAPESEIHGALARQREIETLQAALAERTAAVEQTKAAQLTAETELKSRRDTHGREVAAAASQQRRCHDLELQLLQLQQAAETANRRLAQIDAEATELLMQIEQETLHREESEASHAVQVERRDHLLAMREQARGDRNEADVALARTRETQRAAERKAQEASFAERRAHDRVEELRRRLDLLHQQALRLDEQRAELAAELEMIDLEPLQESRQAALEARQLKEKALAAARDAAEAIGARLRAGEEERMRLEHQLEPARKKIEDSRLKEQAAQLAAEQHTEALAAVQADLAMLADKFQAVQRPNTLPGEIERLKAAIEALGPVNLAALQELTVAQERKGFLDAQSADLMEAVETLEAAIRRIDKETRALLQETYDTVNTHFGQLFPRLFGGGQARLVLTGEEILDAGVQVIAQPPGKRNSSIHLLSGGEKALTAISLVFAFFQLNPAPFCLLDEVDAPLDDSNTERFSNMVKEMSAHTQFLYISHNKIAMEMATQLVGITMPEPGVSRVVAVDVQEALQMAESGAGQSAPAPAV